MSAKTAKAAAEKLVEMARAANVDLPMDKKVATVSAGQVLLMHKNGDEFDLDAALKELKEKYGEVKAATSPAAKKGAKKVKKEDGEAAKPKRATKAKAVKDEEEEEEDGASSKAAKRARPKKEEKDDGSGDEGSPSKKKSKKKEAVCPENAEMAQCFFELGSHCFKEGDRMRGSALMRVYTALMEHPEVITSGKQAGKIKNIGKSSAQKIDEFLASGKMEALETIRAEKNQVM